MIHMFSIKKTFILGLIITSATFGVITTQANAATTKTVAPKAPYMLSKSEDLTSVSLGATNTFHARFVSPAGTTKVLVDFDLYDQNGKRVGNTFQDNVSITASTTDIHNVFTFTSPQTLLPGVYSWKVGIFKPGWTGTIAWYETVLSFTVTSKSVLKNPTTVTLGGVWTPDSILSVGSAAYISAQFRNGNSPSHISPDFLLFDSKNNIVAERYIDDVWFDPLDLVTRSHTSGALKAGTYHWSVAVFSPGKTTLYAWFDSIKTFKVK